MEEQPSMDEILASIRRILSPETADGETQQQPPVVELTESMCVSSQPSVAEESEPEREDVDAPVVEPEVASLPDDVTALELPEHITFDEDEFFKEDEKTAPEKAFSSPVEETSAHKTTAADSVLLEILRPLLREWLDKNMPRLVESCIQQELKKERHGSSSF